MNKLIEKLGGLWKKPKPPTPDTPAPPADTDNAIPWVRVGIILRSIPFKKLLPAFFAVPTLLFFAISGLIAWIMLVLRFAVNIFNLWS